MPKLDFDPRRDGFHFDNGFVNYVFGQGIGITTSGRCGGMAAASVDYYRSEIPIPAHISADLPRVPPASRPVPAEGTRLSQFIYDRLMSTLVNVKASRFMLLPTASDADCFNWSINDEFPKIVEEIDSGRLAIIGLWGKEPGQIGRGHQIVCYGYDLAPQRLWVYDNNRHDQECQLIAISATDGVGVQHAACSMQHAACSMQGVWIRIKDTSYTT